jgi:hypothetical protein
VRPPLSALATNAELHRPTFNALRVSFSHDKETNITRMKCRSNLVVDLGIGMLQEHLGKYEDELTKLFPRWIFKDIVAEWCVKKEELNVINIARKHQAKAFEDRQPFQRLPKPPSKHALAASKPLTDPTRASKRRFGDVPASVLRKEVAAARKDDDEEAALIPEDIHLTTPEVLKRRAIAEAGALLGGARLYDDVLKSNKRLIDVVTAANSEEKSNPAKKHKGYVISRAEHEDKVKEYKRQVTQLQALNADLIGQIVCLKTTARSNAPANSPQPGSSSSFEVAHLKIQLAEVKHKLEKVVSQKNRLVTVAASVGFAPTEHNLDALRDWLKNMFTDLVTIDHGPALP